MKRALAVAFLVVAVSSGVAEAARVRVTRTGPHRARVTVRTGFPIHRTLPTVVVRAGTVRVAPRVYLAPVRFAAVAVTRPVGSWSAQESLEADEGWTDFNLDVDRRGTKLYLEVDRGPARISFAEVVFDNGETQVVDFDDSVHAQGVYSLLDFANGRKIDHVRVVANAAGRATVIRVHLV